MKIRSVLIANRGEIALRVIRGCREMGLKSIAVYSDADVNSLHIRMADEAERIGGPSPSESYLNMDRIVEVALKAGADAVHPGYGFLAENSLFAEKCEKAGLIFVGPGSRTLSLTGNKLQCRKKVEEAGIRVLPGYDVIIEDESLALDVAERIGYPVLLKSVFGGGGRGIRIAHNSGELKETFSSAQAEAVAAFGRFGVYIERFLTKARHVEFQILFDGHGKGIHLCERECSIQRRFQKLIELSPSPIMDEKLRDEMGAMALKIAEAVGYVNAGTIEFLVDDFLNYYFIEVNSRLQVEHPVTELVTGWDLMKEQLRIASGEELGHGQEGIRLTGCAIECRINAEDPLNEFLPSAGRIHRLRLPAGPGVRVDTALYPEYEVPEFYDSLVAKLIVWGRDFEESRTRMKNALSEFVVEGIPTTIPFHRLVMEDEYFVKGILSTDFIDVRDIGGRLLTFEREARRSKEEMAAALAALHLFQKPMNRRTTIQTLPPVRRNGLGSPTTYGSERFIEPL